MIRYLFDPGMRDGHEHEHPGSYFREQFFGLKILEFVDADPGSGIFLALDPGSGINIPDP
jgi:hypothetical protein